MEIRVVDLIDSTFCVASGDGNKVFEVLKKYILDRKNVVLSFEGVDVLISAFLNNAIGKLYDGKIEKGNIEELLQFKGLSEIDKSLLNRVVENAIEFYKNPDRYMADYEEAVN